MERLEKFYNEIKNIKYGWYDKDNILHTKIESHLMLEKYKMQNIDDIKKNGYSICWDLCELERDFLTKNNYEHKIIFIIEKDNVKMPCHTTCIVKIDENYYLLEASHINHKCLKRFSEEKEIYEYLKDNFEDFNKDYIKENIEIYEYPKPKNNINCKEFYENALNSKKINV